MARDPTRRITGDVFADYTRRVSNDSSTSDTSNKDTLTLDDQLKKLVDTKKVTRDDLKEIDETISIIYGQYKYVVNEFTNLQANFTDLQGKYNKDIAAAEEEKDDGMDKLRNLLANEQTKTQDLASKLADMVLNPSNPHKPARLPDPKEQLSDGVKPHIQDFILVVRNKLRAEPWNFPSEDHKIAYIASFCKGRAIELLRARLQPDHALKFTSGEQMLEVLQRGLGKSTEVRKEEARAELAKLYQNTTPFIEFWSNLERLCIELNKPDDQVLDELRHRMNIELKNALVTHTSRSLQEVVQLCHIVESRQNQLRTQTKSRFNKATTRPSNRLAPDTNHANPAPSTRDTTSMTCFLCRTQGHLAKDCPDKHLFSKKKAKVQFVAAEESTDDDTQDELSEDEADEEGKKSKGKDELHA